MKDIFISAPRDVIATIDSITRVEMTLYHEAGSPTASKNLFGGPCRIEFLTDNEIQIKTSSASELRLYRLPAAKGDSVILAVTTVLLPAVDSRCVMYSSDWKPLPAKMQLPDTNNLELWLTPEGKSRRTEIENAVPFVPAYYICSTAQSSLIVDSSIRQLLGKENYDEIAACLKKVISYKWDGKKWSLITK